MNMKKIALIMTMIVMLSACVMGDNTLKRQDMSQGTFPVAALWDGSGGYVVCGLIDSEMVNVQEADNHLRFNLTGYETYTVISDDGEYFTLEGTGFDRYVSELNGENMIIIDLNGAYLDETKKYIAIGNMTDTPIIAKREIIDEMGSFELDFDNDGHKEKVILEQNNNWFTVTVRYKMGMEEIYRYEFDDYTYGADVFSVDVDNNGDFELIVWEEGHNATINIYDIDENHAELVASHYNGD